MYGVRDASNGRVVYVGVTVQALEVRFAQHRRDKRPLPLARWLAKHPDAFVTTLECDADMEREKWWIAYFGLENLLNVSAGGNGGFIPGNAATKGRPKSAEHRAALSRPMPDKTRAALAEANARRTRESRSEASRKSLATRRVQASHDVIR